MVGRLFNPFEEQVVQSLLGSDNGSQREQSFRHHDLAVYYVLCGIS